MSVSAVLTTLMSSISIDVARQATPIVIPGCLPLLGFMGEAPP